MAIEFFTTCQPFLCYLKQKQILDCKNIFFAYKCCINFFFHNNNDFFSNTKKDGKAKKGENIKIV